MFRIELLPAAHGDAIWIEYGDHHRPHRIVIDGGPAPAYEQGLRQRIVQLPEDDRRIDLFVITHIDADHIDGAIILLQEAEALHVTLREIWFNGWPQITRQLESQGPPVYQPEQGEFLTALIEKDGIHTIRNRRRGGAIVVADQTGPLPTYELEGGARLTLLSPGMKQLQRLQTRWASALRDFSPGDSAEALRRLKLRRAYRPPAPPVFGVHGAGDDRSAANGASIAFILEYDGAACLFAADAHPRVLTASLRRVAQLKNPAGTGPVRLDAITLPHHGSFSNISDEFVTAVECHTWLVSTNGDHHGHPHDKTAALVARHASTAPLFLCNYKVDSTITLAKAAEAADPGTASPGWIVKYPGDEGIPSGPAGGVMYDLANRG